MCYLLLVAEIEILHTNIIDNYQCNFRKWASTVGLLKFWQRACTLRSLYKVQLYLMWTGAFVGNWKTQRINECNIHAWYRASNVSQWKQNMWIWNEIYSRKMVAGRKYEVKDKFECLHCIFPKSGEEGSCIDESA